MQMNELLLHNSKQKKPDTHTEICPIIPFI